MYAKGSTSDLGNSCSYGSFKNCIWIQCLTLSDLAQLDKMGKFYLAELQNCEGKFLFLVSRGGGASPSEDLIVQPSETAMVTKFHKI